MPPHHITGVGLEQEPGPAEILDSSSVTRHAISSTGLGFISFGRSSGRCASILEESVGVTAIGS